MGEAYFGLYFNQYIYRLIIFNKILKKGVCALLFSYVTLVLILYQSLNDMHSFCVS